MPDAFEIQRLAAASIDPDATRELRTGSARIIKVRSLISALPKGTSILDVGCSDGTLLSPFVTKLRLHGIDGEPSLVAEATKKGFKAIIGDVENLPYENALFDAVFAGEVIEHTISPDRFLCGINRILKTNGSLFLTAPNIRTPVGLLMLIYGFPPMFAARYRSTHLRDFTLPLIKAALTNNGFQLVQVLGSAFMIPGLGSRLGALANLIPSWADHFIIRATKVREVIYDPACEFAGIY